MFSWWFLIVIFGLVLLNSIPVIPIQLQVEEGEEIKGNKVEDSHINDCISQRNTAVGACFGKELLNKLNEYDEADTFSLATGVALIRDEKTPRNFGYFLDKDPMDFRSMMEDASELISKRSLQWGLSGMYPGLVMRIGPTLANGILEFVVDPKIKDRTYHQNEQLSTGRLLARNFLVPFLLGFKFQISTLLPLLLGLLLLATKKAFFLTKLALIAVTIFGGGFSSNSYGQGSYNDFVGPSLSSYTSWDNPGHQHSHIGHGGFYHRPPHHIESFYKEKSSEQTSVSPITPDELRDRLERLFITKKEDRDEPRQEILPVRNARNFAWTPINTG